MGRKFKLDPKIAAATVRNTHYSDAKKALLDATLITKTANTYKSRIKYLHAILSELNEPTLTPELFVRILQAIRNDYEGHSAEQMRDAVLHAQHSEGLWLTSTGEAWAERPYIIKTCQGFRYNHGLPNSLSRPRGMITPSALTYAVQSARSQHLHYFVPALEIQFGAALRKGELFLIQSGDYDSATKLLLIRKNKRAKATNSKPRFYHKPVTNTSAIYYLEQKQKETVPGQLLFPRHLFKMSDYATFVRVTLNSADCPEFDPDLSIVNHSLRHGGTAQIITNLGQNPTEEAMAKHTAMSKSTRKRYTRPNADRKRKRS